MYISAMSCASQLLQQEGIFALWLPVDVMKADSCLLNSASVWRLGRTEAGRASGGLDSQLFCGCVIFPVYQFRRDHDNNDSADQNRHRNAPNGSVSGCLMVYSLERHFLELLNTTQYISLNGAVNIFILIFNVFLTK